MYTYDVYTRYILITPAIDCSEAIASPLAHVATLEIGKWCFCHLDWVYIIYTYIYILYPHAY